MAQIVMSDCKVWAGGYDVSGSLNAIALLDAPDALDNTTFGCTAKSRKKGLEVVTADLEGFWSAPSPDVHFSSLGVASGMTIAPVKTVGTPAYSFRSQNIEYTLGGMIGELCKFSVKAESIGTKLIRGWILENGETARIANGNGAAFELGAVGAAQYLYGALHVIAAATAVGDTLDVVIESDSQADFGGTPEDQIEFTQVLGNGGVKYEWATPIIGAIADTFWRCKWTIAGGAGKSFNFACFMGIL